MDLLGGYDSDSDNDSDSGSPPLNSQPTPKQTEPSVSAKTVAATNLGRIQKTSEGTKSASSSNRKGKKLLKLQAVLPANIWNQLSNGDLQKDSDDEESDEEGIKRTVASRKRRTPSGNGASQNPGDKSDLKNLLQALPKSKATIGVGGGIGKSILQDSDDFSNTIIGSTNTPSSTTKAKPASASLGAAFLSSTVETIRKKKSGPNTVRNIHGQSSSVVVETVDDDNDIDGDGTEDSNSLPNTSTAPRNVSPSLHTSVRASSSVPRPGMSSLASSGGYTRARMAAPPVSAARYQQQPQPSYPLPPGMTPYASTATNIVAPPVPPAQLPQGGQKSRKREMERMLRQGNLSGVTSDVHLEGQAHVYQPPQESQQQAYQSHGVRVVPTAQYNASTGGIVTAAKITGKQRGKNQMNALLVSAASLEAQRARNPLPQQKIQRANAKRKYGW